MNEIIKTKENFTSVEKVLAEARNVLEEIGVENLELKEKHFIYFKGKEVNDLVIVTYNRKWVIRKCTDEEWLEYFNNYIMKKDEETSR